MSIMETTLVSEIARKILLKTANAPKEMQKTASNMVSDRVTFSEEAVAMQKVNSYMSDYDHAREIRVAELKHRVQEGGYQLDSKVIDKIAEKIADMFF